MPFCRHSQDLFFRKEDEIALRRLLAKAKAQADVSAHDAEERSPKSSGLRGGYGGDSGSAMQSEDGGAAVKAAPNEGAEAVAPPAGVAARGQTSGELDALRPLAEKYKLSPADVEALLAWRHSHEF